MSLKSESGVSVAELVVAIAAGIAVLLGVFTVSTGVLRGSARVQQRVDATQRARPVLTHMLDEMHSACVSPGIAPVLAGSDSSSITFLHKTGTAVTPNPDKRVISLSGTTLSESVYPYAAGTAPSWLFGTTPTTTRLLTNVGSGSVGGVTVPLFRYYAYDQTTGAINPTPLPVPLSQDDSERAVQVDVVFSSSPSKTLLTEISSAQRTAMTVDDSVLFRFTPAAEDASQSQLPCT